MTLSIRDEHWGGGENVFIQLNNDETSCETSHKPPFWRGDKLTWTGSEFGTCDGLVFNIKKTWLGFKLRTTDGDKFAPETLTVIMNNGFVYEKTGMNDWVNNDDDKIGTAELVTLGKYKVFFNALSDFGSLECHQNQSVGLESWYVHVL